jgi:hypothetical protein
LYDLIRRSIPSPFSLTFIASGRGGGGNAEAVVSLVMKLRGDGNDRVWGIVDRDNRGSAPTGVFYNPDRYSLENVILDPLAVGVYLIRQGSLQLSDAGLAEDVRHHSLSASDAAALAGFVVARVQNPQDDATLKRHVYANGMSIEVPAFWSEMQGHELEGRLTEAFEGLRADKSSLKSNVVRFALADVPGYVPADAVKLFASLLAPHPE